MPKSRASATSAARRSACPIACALDLLGDRWTLLVIRDLLRGHSRFGHFADAPEGIPTNVLAERLKRLESAGIIASSTYQDNPPRLAYGLTPKGQALRPVLAALATWSMKHLPGTKPDKQLLQLLGG